MEENMSNLCNVLEAMDQAAYVLESLPPDEWADWVTYLLECLEEETDDKVYRDFLEALRLAITTRLEENTW
jgi:hypothetical protein